MEKVINSYEAMFIVDVTNDEVTKATVSKFTTLIANNAEVVDIDEWGKRRLAYPINDMNEGYYVVVTFKSAPDFPAELERLATIDEALLRSMVLKLEYEAVPRQKSAPADEAPAEETVAEEAAEAPAAEEAPAATDAE